MYRIIIRSKAIKDLKGQSPEVQRRILNKIEYYSSVDSPLSFAHPLVHSGGLYRFRNGDYRIIFHIQEDLIVIHAIGHRREIYK